MTRVSPTTHSGKPYSAKAVMEWTMLSAASPAMPWRAMPARSFASTSPMRALAALEAEGAAQLLGLAAGEAGGDHRHAQELLLEERHAERALQDRLEARDAVPSRGSRPARRRR